MVSVLYMPALVFYCARSLLPREDAFPSLLHTQGGLKEEIKMSGYKISKKEVCIFQTAAHMPNCASFAHVVRARAHDRNKEVVCSEQSTTVLHDCPCVVAPQFM